MTLFFDQTACGNAGVARILPGMTAQTSHDWRQTSRLERKRTPTGPRSLLIGTEIAQIFIEAWPCSVGLERMDAHDIWNAAGLHVLERSFDLQPDAILLPISLAVWRQEAGRWAVAPVGADGRFDGDLHAMLKAAEAAGRPIVQLRADELSDRVESLIREHFPTCDACRGPAAPRALRAAVSQISVH